jgi:hypothetical protein
MDDEGATFKRNCNQQRHLHGNYHRQVHLTLHLTLLWHPTHSDRSPPPLFILALTAMATALTSNDVYSEFSTRNGSLLMQLLRKVTSLSQKQEGKREERGKKERKKKKEKKKEKKEIFVTYQLQATASEGFPFPCVVLCGLYLSTCFIHFHLPCPYMLVVSSYSYRNYCSFST